MYKLSPAALALALLFPFTTTGCGHSHDESHEAHDEHHKLVVTQPVSKDVVSTRRYVSQIHSRRHIEVRALESGYLDEVNVHEGQSVKKGDVMFRIIPVLYQASLDTEVAEARLAQIKFKNTKLLADKNIVSDQELAISRAELAKAMATVNRARAELNFTAVKASFAGIIDRQRAQQGSLVSEGDILSTLSDNEVMWVYFNVPEVGYLDYQAHLKENEEGIKVELELANGQIFPQPGKIAAIEADFNNETGNIPFRADFGNPEGLLRHGQTGTILLHRQLHDAIVIPQRATYEILAKRYVFVIEPLAGGGDTHTAAQHEGAREGTGRGIVRQREITIAEELDDIYVIEKGLSVNDRIIFEGIRQVKDGEEVEYELRDPQKILVDLKHHAE